MHTGCWMFDATAAATFWAPVSQIMEPQGPGQLESNIDWYGMLPESACLLWHWGLALNQPLEGIRNHQTVGGNSVRKTHNGLPQPLRQRVCILLPQSSLKVFEDCQG